jgi:hypothetical protein
MSRLLLASIMALSLATPFQALADDTAAPVTSAPAAATQTDGCMPGGGCCGGSAACPKAPRDAKGKVSGGCPCQRAKAAAQQGSQPPANP